MPRSERERQMLDVAHALFARRGFASVTMDDVAGAVGVTKPLLYSYWGNKETLFLACMDRSSEALFAAVLEAVRAAEDAPAAVRAAIRAFFAFVDAERDAWRVVFDPSFPADGAIAARVTAQRARLTNLLAEAFLELVPARHRRRVRVDVEARSHAILGAAEGLARWWLISGGMTAARAADLLVETVVPGLPAPRPPKDIPE
jgi:AcrR family transcriptional regulator